MLRAPEALLIYRDFLGELTAVKLGAADVLRYVSSP